ncbi:MAG: prenyltransferase/squalene oxidase repeat-containing protein [Bdellovibrionota bacterium]
MIHKYSKNMTSIMLIFFNIVSCKSRHTYAKNTIQSEKQTDNTMSENALIQAIESGACLADSIRKSQNITNSKHENKLEYWSLRPYLGTVYIGQYYLLQNWLNQPYGEMDTNHFANILLNSQLENGSWIAVNDSYIKRLANGYNPTNYRFGELDTTVFNYWVLKAMSLKGELNDETYNLLLEKKALERALQFILEQRKIKDFAPLTKIFLALFNNYNWDHVIKRNGLQKLLRISAIPLWWTSDFMNALGIGTKSFGQWIPALVKPLAYAIAVKPSKNIGHFFDLKEEFKLTAEEMPQHHNRPPAQTNQKRLTKLIKHILSTQAEKGSFSGYTLHTHFTLSILDDYKLRFLKCVDNPEKEQCKKIDEVSEKGLWFIKNLSFASEHTDDFDTFKNKATSSYLGVTCDGTFWDTILIGQALLNSGFSQESLMPVTKYILNQQDKTKPYKGHQGFPFGWDFWQDPDNDDTAEFLLYLHYYTQDSNPTRNKKITSNAFEKIKEAINKAILYLLAMQNKDGGWGAFAHENNENPFLKAFASSLSNSADLFDDSSVDVTGHVLESLSPFEFKNKEQSLTKAVQFIESRQKEYYERDPKTKAPKLDQHGQPIKKKGPWFGRWGVNYIYGTNAAVLGIAKVVDHPEERQSIKDAMRWLKNIQNEDGGFGESSLSYQKEAPNFWMGIGDSTPTQTAWAISALVAGGEANSITTTRAVNYLIKEIQTKKQWIDLSVVGTGHPGIVYMQYPAYAYAFPLIALNQYRKKLGLDIADINCQQK